MSKVVLVTDLSKLAAAIKAHAGKRAKIDEETHVLALSAANAVAEHGNVHYVNALYKAMGKGARHVALTTWFTAYAGVSANTGKDKADMPFIFDKRKAVDLVGGEAQPWYECKPSPEPDAVLDVYKLVEAVIAKATKPKEGQTVINAGLIAELQATLAGVQREEAPTAEVEVE